MKKASSGWLAVLFLLGASAAHAQLGDFFNKIKDKAQQEVNNAEDKVINDTADKIEGKKTDQNNNNNQSANRQQTASAAQPPSVASYKNYDFVPGDKIIFESNLADERTGEIPSQFTLLQGQVDVESVDGENVIHVPKGDGATFTPRTSKQGYMPERFTIEFDFKNEAFGLNHVIVDFGHRVYYSGGEGIMPGVRFDSEGIDWTLDAKYPPELSAGFAPMQWHHIAIAINGATGKVYVDQYRVLNVNNLTGKPNNVTLDVNGYENSFIKNVRIAAGGIDVYKQVTTLTKIVTHGILFDVDQATLKPESMGTLNEIADLMRKNSSLNFEIDGHTDNTGNAAHNLTLSKQRAEAVKAQLVSMGIDAARLKTAGFGDTKPIDSNDTPEGRANNRRVEFVKF
ncbi:MAG: OmpA family protein [Sinobacteraceae bacterium]|nr:OmpA family protein [Nevskiaceae bacterium]